MTSSPFATTFLRQLRYWAFHSSLNALPSLFIALFFLNLLERPSAVAAMLCAIATFILLYAAITSLSEPLADPTHVLSRSLKLGAKIRAWISGLSLLVVFTPAMSVSPDFWCGWLAVNIVNHLTQLMGLNSGGYVPNTDFLSIYATTLLEGFILSFILLMISFFALIFLQSRDRRKYFAADRSL
ncbi:MAG TPA: hypothetical protein VF258_10875 [Luteolibacter sp.]